MSADGEIEVAVKAEGADDAADELAEGAEAAPTPGGGEGGGGLRQSLRGGVIGGLLASLAGPILDVLEPISDLLNAFLAPVAIMLLRLFQPILRELIQFLPQWISWVDKTGSLLEHLGALGKIATAVLAVVSPIGFMVALLRALGVDVKALASDIWNFVSRLPEQIWNFVSQLPGQIWNFMQRLPGQIWNFMQRLPGLIGEQIASKLPSIPGGDGVTSQVQEFAGDALGGGGGGGTNISIGGGLAPFINQVEASNDVDLLP